ncbi:Rhomboid protease GluP [Maioricimonas rarisocia]|uniref:Rhomboid protease GluP n=1 Tax=Maioricimonas rarisocia TaxID=2528026 RepID=A0A517ZDR3_9PLAN|nr:rhomboid family intramembrane serine protease [Maioricimonas rarisocia]QDU40621.1 Rhomboid protease GluP [Maioricimonas rarisocia]
MFIPVGTDAPIYYRPFATIGLIAANIGTFLLTAGGTEPAGWLLTFGNGLRPWEWLTSPFLHFGIFHLLGNMVFLWSFGLIIEGKLGWLRFLALYGFLACAGGFITQLLMLFSDSPGAGGASGVIYSLMAISLIWAPRNCVDVLIVYAIGFYVRTTVVDVTVLTFSACYIGFNLLFAWLGGFTMSSEVLHLLGAAVGVPVGILMVKRNMVDCEDWDLFSVMRGDHLKLTTGEATVQPMRKWKSSDKQDHSQSQVRRKKPNAARQLKSVREMIAQQRYLGAWTKYDSLRSASSKARLDEKAMRELSEGLRRQEEWSPLVKLLDEYIEQFPESDRQARILLAAILSQQHQRPRAALRALEPIDPAFLKPEQRRQYEKVHRAAQQLIEEGVLELSGE